MGDKKNDETTNKCQDEITTPKEKKTNNNDKRK